MDFATVYDDHVWHVYAFFAYHVPSRDDAEDLTQLAFERALRAWERFDPGRASARTWLLAIARNLLVDHHRRQRTAGHGAFRDGVADEAALGHSPGPEEALGVSPELAEALAKLSVRDREVVALRFGGSLTGPEIAAMLGLSLANVQQILSRSLRRLRAELERQEAESLEAAGERRLA